MTTLYNCHHDGDQYRITKFTDANPEASYLCTEVECECPAGARPSCRHRQMLPVFIAEDLVNTHWFLAWDAGRQIVDIVGNTKDLMDRLALSRTTPTPAMVPEHQPPKAELTIASYISLPADADIATEFANLRSAHPPTKPTWRRI